MEQEKRRVLGRGLDSLIPAVRTATVATVTLEAAAEQETVREIPLDLIEKNPYQPRGVMDESALAELAESIKAQGVVQPIVVRPLPGLRYQLIAGERRLVASRMAAKQTIPAIVRRVSNAQAMEMTIIENLQREDLNPMEQARAFERLSQEFGMTQEQISARTGKERASIANFMRLLKLPFHVQALVEVGKLSFGHAKVLMMLEDAAAIHKIADQVAEQALSVRQTEELVHSIIHPAERAPKKQRQVDPNVRQAERTLREALGVRVIIKDRNGRGKIVLEYGSLEDFDRIVEVLGKN